MTTTLENESGIGPEKYSAQIGKFWTEILDHHPFIQKFLKQNQSRVKFIPSESSRTYGRNKRMVLKHSSDQALLIFKKKKALMGYYGMECVVFINNSEEHSADLLRDAVRLAFSQWPGQKLFITILREDKTFENMHESVKNAGWSEVLTNDKLVILEKELKM